MLRILPLLVFACTVSAQVTYYAAALDGAQQVPPLASAGSGFATVRLAEPANSVSIFMHFDGLPGATAAHLHLAPAGINGPVIVPLTAGPGSTFTAVATLPAAQVAALKAAGTYINLHSAAHPGGEIRGQVVAAVSTRLRATLDGAQTLPPNASAAVGRADAYLHEPDNRLVYCVETTGLGTITAAHLHLAPAGTPGGVIFPLNGSGGVYCGVSPRLTISQVAALLADGTYFNVHTTAFPAGEIRGQLLRDPGSDFVAVIDGLQSVPPNPSAGLGAGSLHVDKDGTAHVEVSFGGLIGTATVSHIHNAPAGVNGGVAVPLVLSGGKFVATFTPTTTQLAQLRSGTWYVNVHTTAFPAGEIRGQLLPATLPSTYGPNCAGSNGQRPEIGATSFAGLGATVAIDLYGASAGAPAFLALGFNRDAGLLGPLPLPFAAAGLNVPCFFLLDPLAALLSFADGNGCATRSLSFGFVPSLRGLLAYGQWIVLDAAANPAGLVASNALSMILQ